MLFGGERWSLGSELPGRGPLTVYGFITGLFSSLVGVSGGAISNAVLTLYGKPMQRAVGDLGRRRRADHHRRHHRLHARRLAAHGANCRLCRSASCR